MFSFLTERREQNTQAVNPLFRLFTDCLCATALRGLSNGGASVRPTHSVPESVRSDAFFPAPKSSVSLLRTRLSRLYRVVRILLLPRVFYSDARAKFFSRSRV